MHGVVKREKPTDFNDMKSITRKGEYLIMNGNVKEIAI